MDGGVAPSSAVTLTIYSCVLFLITDSNVFPSNVSQCGVTESILQKAFLQCLEGRQDLCWTLTKSVTVGFYRHLHHYLRHWPPSRSATKTTVGRFYLLVDENFQSGSMSSRPDNVYLFVQRVADSCKLNSEPMYYGIDNTVEQLVCQAIKRILMWCHRKCPNNKKP